MTYYLTKYLTAIRNRKKNAKRQANEKYFLVPFIHPGPERAKSSNFVPNIIPSNKHENCLYIESIIGMFRDRGL